MGGGYTIVGQREDLCGPHVGFAQRCGVISLTLWLFGREIETNEKKKSTNVTNGSAAKNHLRPQAVASDARDYGRRFERSPCLTHAISPSPPGGLGCGDDVWLLSLNMRSCLRVAAIGRRRESFHQNLMTSPDNLSHVRCTWGRFLHRLGLFDTSAGKVFEGGYAQSADERKLSLKQKHVSAEKFLLMPFRL